MPVRLQVLIKMLIQFLKHEYNLRLKSEKQTKQPQKTKTQEKRPPVIACRSAKR